MSKLYGSIDDYEAKLRRVMERLSIEKYNFDWSRNSCWVEFYYKGNLYRFEHSVENAKKHGVKLQYGSDAFAQLVLTLEDIARMTERGIYELQTWVAGMKALPEPQNIPDCFRVFGFSVIPSPEDLKKRYRDIVKVAHPDAGGQKEYFMQIQSSFEEAEAYLRSLECDE